MPVTPSKGAPVGFAFAVHGALYGAFTSIVQMAYAPTVSSLDLNSTSLRSGDAAVDAEALSRVIAEVHSGIFERPFTEFRAISLERVRSILPFDAAVWGSGVFSAKTMLTANPIGLDAQAVLEYATRWQGPD